MNAELYSMRSTDEEISSLNSQIGRISEGLKNKNVDVLYKTEVSYSKLNLLQAIKQTFTSKDNIDIIIIANALDGDKDNVIFKTLCGLTSNKDTTEKAKVNQPLEKDVSTLVTAYDIDTTDKTKKEIEDDSVLYANGVSLGDFGKGYEAYCFFCGERKIIALPKETLTNVAVSEMAMDAVAMSLPKTPIAVNLLPKKGIAFVPENGTVLNNKKKKRGFWSGIIPMRGDSGKEVARKFILIVAILTFLVTAGILIYQMVINPMMNNKKNDELRDIFYSSTTKETDPETGETKSSRNWDGLLDINSQVVGWVTIPDTNIDYVVMQNEKDTIDYQKYLYHDIYQNWSGYGSVFEDFRSKGGSSAKNIILHGHNMLDGSMFANLIHYGKYTGDLDYYKSHPVIEYDTPEYDAEWEIISVYKTNTEDAHGKFFNYLTGEFASDAEFMNYIYLVRERSLIDTPVKVNEDDQIITLSTCSYEYSEFRTVVVARRLRDGEAKADYSKAALNPNPLWPDVYYSNNGGEKPKVTSFKQAYKDGDISWYDGKGNLEGKERKFTLDENDYVDEDATESTTAETTAPPEATAAPTEPPEPVTQRVDDIEIWFNYSALTMNVGDKETLAITWNPTNTTDRGVVWNSSDTAVANVSATGVVTAVGGGSCTITARSNNGNVASCTVKVNPPIIDVSSVRLKYQSYPLYVGEKVKLESNVYPENATNKSIVWRSSNTSVATVTSDGTVVAVGEGKCNITITSNNGKQASCEMIIYPNP